MAAADGAGPARMNQWVSWLINQVNIHAHRLLSDGLASADSRGYHYRLLAALEEFGPSSQAALARRTGIDRSDVVAALNELADGGLVERSSDPSDRRRNIVTITSAGAEQIQRLERVLTDVQDKLLAPLSPAERQQLMRLLSRVLEARARAPR